MLNVRSFYRIKSIALELGVGRTTVFEWERSGKIPQMLRRGARFAGYTPELMDQAVKLVSPSINV